MKLMMQLVVEIYQTTLIIQKLFTNTMTKAYVLNLLSSGHQETVVFLSISKDLK